MYDNLVAIDIQTTGPDPRRDDIFEMAAVEIIDGRIGRVFHSYADPGIDIPLRARQASGISDENIVSAPPLSAALGDFVRFVGNRRCIAHDFETRRRFIQVGTYEVFQNPVLDTLQLARVLLPTEERHDLDNYAQRYRFKEPTTPGRSAALAEYTAWLWQILLAEADILPMAVLDSIMRLIEPVEWEFKPLFQHIHAGKFADTFGGKAPKLLDSLPDFSELITQAQTHRAAKTKKAEEAEGNPPPVQPLDTERIIGMFGPTGVFAKHLNNFEPRREQARMAKAVAYAFNNERHLMVEAGTGTGKSLAYLVPSVYWSVLNETPVIISTYTRNLQAQLFHKDIPMLTEMLDQRFRAAVIKGRANYLCPRKLIYLLDEAARELADEERIALVPIITWAALTTTGDIGENTGFQIGKSMDVWERLYATGDECRGRACDCWKPCFLLKARALAQLADVVVANHAVVLSELGLSTSTVLPEHRHIIFDEAHNLESVATDQLGRVIDRWTVMRPLNRLYRTRRRDRTGYGLLTNILYHLRRGRETNMNDSEKLIDKAINESFDLVQHIDSLLDAFLISCGGIFTTRESGARLRYDAETRPADKWAEVFAHKDALIAGLSKLVSQLEFVSEGLDELEREFQYQQDFIHQLTSHVGVLQELIDSIDFLMRGDDPNYVYWMECIDFYQGSFRVAGAPIEVGPLLKDLLYEKKDTIVFSSATLAVGDSFDFFTRRMGLDLLSRDRVLSLNLGTSFDFQKQVLFCVPTFLPEPTYRSDEFIRAIEAFLTELHVATAGRGLILFTSYDMLNNVYEKLKDRLEREGVVVLGQGTDGPPDQIIKTFRRINESVLLGTQSFWEGVDVPGESLSCVTLTKLPFAVYTDPIIKARCDAVEARGESSFFGYSVPTAVIRFKQGFGRLIRSKMDRGIVLVLDSRIVTKQYGRSFLASVPVKHRAYGDKTALIDDVVKFLGS